MVLHGEREIPETDRDLVKHLSMILMPLYKIVRRALGKVGFEDFAPKNASRHSRASQVAMEGGSAYDI